MFRSLGKKRIQVVIGKNRAFLAYFASGKLMEYLFIPLDVQTPQNQNAFTNEITNFLQGKEGTYAEVIFDTERQYFMSKALSKKVKGKALNQILLRKIEADYPDPGINHYFELKGDKTGSTNNYLLVSMSTDSGVTLLLNALNYLGCKVLFFRSAPTLIASLTNATKLRKQSVSNASNNQIKKFQRIVENYDSSVFLSVYFSKLSGFRQIVSVGNKVISVLTTEASDLSSKEQAAQVLEDFRNAKEYIRQSLAQEASSMQIGIFFSEDLKEILGQDEDDIYFISLESFCSSFLREGVTSKARQHKSTQAFLEVSKESPFCATIAAYCHAFHHYSIPNHDVHKWYKFFNNFRATLIMATAVLIVITLLLNYAFFTHAPTIKHLNQDIENITQRKEAILQKFNYKAYHEALSAIELNSLNGKYAAFQEFMLMVRSSLGRAGSGISIQELDFRCPWVCQLEEYRPQGTPPTTVFLSGTAESLMDRERFIADLKIELYNYDVRKDEAPSGKASAYNGNIFRIKITRISGPDTNTK